MNLDDFQKTCHQLKRPLLVISGRKGCLSCGYLSMASFERNGDAAAIVRGVDTYEDMLVVFKQHYGDMLANSIADGARWDADVERDVSQS